MATRTASEYVRALIRTAKQSQSAKARLEGLLLEGLESGPAEPFTPDFFEKLKASIRSTQGSTRE